MKVTERFLHYVSFDTQSSETSSSRPSTDKQKLLGADIARELRELGLSDVRFSEEGYVYATLPANCETDAPALALIAHMDTSPDCSGADIRPSIIAYEGGDVVLNREKGIVMSPEEYPSLRRNVGKHLIVTDGTTLLGADDKAGAAEIITAVEELMASNAPHGTVLIAITPDEEVGRGTESFDLEHFPAQYGYTVDGGALGELEYENFNAASGSVVIHGFSIHPGSAKDKMKNACLMAMEFNSLLPAGEIPVNTEGYEGFFHLQEMHGKVEEAAMEYIIRDHSMERFRQRIAAMDAAAEQINRRYGPGTVTVDTQDQYYNMYEVLKDHMEIVELAEAAMKGAGIAEPTHSPIRGGTDGCMLTYQGLLCPNLPSAGHNAHGRFEYAPVGSLKTGVRTVKQLLSPTLIETVFLKKEE